MDACSHPRRRSSRRDVGSEASPDTAPCIETKGQRAAKQNVGSVVPRVERCLLFFDRQGLLRIPSTGETVDYKFFHEHMLAVSPALVVQSAKWREFTIHHGAGVLYNFLFGQDFRRFDKFAFTITPIDFAVGRVSGGFTFACIQTASRRTNSGLGPRLALQPPERVGIQDFNFAGRFQTDSTLFDSRQHIACLAVCRSRLQ